MSGRPTLGDLIRSIDYSNIKSYDGRPDHPVTKLKALKHECVDDGISFNELKDGYKAFEKKICVKDFPEADKPGFEGACKTAKILNRITDSFLDRNGDMFMEVSDCRFHILMSLLQAGLNSTHITLLWFWTEGWGGLETYLRMLETGQLIQLLRASKITFRYPRNRELDEEAYISTLRYRLAEIFEKIGLDQYEPQEAQREFLDLYQHYNIQIPGLSETLAKEVYFLTRNMLKPFQDENPYLELKDVAILKKHLNTVQEMVCSKRYKNDGPIDDAAKVVVENIMKAGIEEDLVASLFDHIMEVIIKIYQHENARKEAGLVVNKIRTYLIREIGDRKIPVEPLFKSCLHMVESTMVKGGLSDDSRLMAEDVIDIFVKEVKHPSEDDVKQILSFIRSIVLSGSRDLLITIKSILKSLEEQNVLDWKKYLGEAKGILMAIGEVTVKSIRDDGELRRTVMEYRDFVEDYLKILSKTEIKLDIQGSLVAMFFNCVEDETMTKIEFADASVDTDWWDLSKEKKLRIEVLTKCDCMLKNEKLDWQNPYLIGAVGKIINLIASSYEGDGKSVDAKENQLFVSIFLTVSEGGNSVIKHWYQFGYQERPNVKMRIWNGALRRFVELHQKSATLACVAPVMPNIMRWTQIAVKEKHEDMTDCLVCILTTIGRNPPPEFNCYISELLDLQLKSDKCQDLYHLISELYPHNPDAVHKRLPDVFKSLNKSSTKDQTNIPWVLHAVSEHHPEVFTKGHIGSIFERAKNGNSQEHSVMLMIIRNISEKCPAILVEFFPSLCDGAIFKEDSVTTRSAVIAAIAVENKALGQKAVDYLMKFALFSGPPTSTCALSAVSSMIETHRDCVLPYKTKLEKLAKSCKVPQVKELIHTMIHMMKGDTNEDKQVEVKDANPSELVKEPQQNIAEGELRSYNKVSNNGEDLNGRNNKEPVNETATDKTNTVQDRKKIKSNNVDENNINFIDSDRTNGNVSEVNNRNKKDQVTECAKIQTTDDTLDPSDRIRVDQTRSMQTKESSYDKDRASSPLERSNKNKQKSQSCILF